MYKYTVRFYLKKKDSYPVKANEFKLKGNLLIDLTKDTLCDMEDIKKEIQGLFSSRLGKVQIDTIDTKEIESQLGDVEKILLNEYSRIGIEYITNAMYRGMLNKYGQIVNLNTPDDRKFAYITVNDIEKVIQYDISDKDYRTYRELADGLLTPPYAATGNRWTNQCVIKLKNGYYGLCNAIEEDYITKKVKVNYIQFFKEKGLYEVQTFKDYKNFVLKVKGC